MFTTHNTEGYTTEELARANALLAEWDAANPDADSDTRKAACEQILYTLDAE